MVGHLPPLLHVPRPRRHPGPRRGDGRAARSAARPSASWPARCARWCTAAGETERAEHAAAALFSEEVSRLDERSILDVFADAPSTTLPRSPARRWGRCRWSTCWSRPGWRPRGAGRATTIEQGGAYLNNRRAEDVGRSVGADDLVAGRYLILRSGKRNYHLVSFD